MYLCKSFDINSNFMCKFISAAYCFVKYATFEEADRAIRALHNQHTIPGVSSSVDIHDE